MRKLLVVMGAPIDDLDMPAALAGIEEFIRQGRMNGSTHQIVTVNADFVIKAQGDPELRQILQEAHMATADGMPLVWGARLLGVPLPGRVTGADLIPALAGIAAEKGYSFYLLGGGPGVAVRAAEAMRERYPALRIVGAVSPPYRSVLETDPALLDDIRLARPDLLLVAFGNPKQEKWIAMHARELGVPVMIGVGGTLDFIAGVTRRAPDWMQRSGLEWSYRLLQEPRRLWRRYVVDLAGFVYFFARQLWALRRPIAETSTIVPTTGAVLIDDVAIVSVEARLTLATRDSFQAQTDEALSHTSFLIVDLSRVSFMDSSGCGMLVALAERVRAAGGWLRLAGLQPQVAQVLKVLRLDKFFESFADLPSAMAAAKYSGAPEHGAPPPVDLAPDGWQAVKAPRRLDALTAPEFREQCSALLGACPRLVVDFSETTFLASAGLAILIALSRAALESNGELRLACLSPDALRVVKIAKLESVFALYPDLASAAS